MEIPKAVKLKKPKFVWLQCCGKCPTEIGNKKGYHDPESMDIANIPERWKRLRFAFACAWRPQGYCHANYKLLYRGVNGN